MVRHKLIVPLLLMLLAGCSVPLTYEVVHIRDGDTIEVMAAGLRVPVRFAGVDTPKRGEPGYGEAKQAITDMLLGQRVHVEQDGLGRYNRIIGKVYLHGRDICQWLLDEGYATEYRGK